MEYGLSVIFAGLCQGVVGARIDDVYSTAHEALHGQTDIVFPSASTPDTRIITRSMSPISARA
jgi:hypothetical protein